MVKHFLIGILILAPVLSDAQDVDTQFLRLQEAYSQKLQDLEQKYDLQQRELLNKFILALVRTEKAYLEEGNLDGVMTSRQLREDLLQNPEIPTPQDIWPERILEMARELQRRSVENRTTSQAELNRLNGILLRTLEPYKVEFTRQGNLQKAIEVRTLQEKLSEALDIDSRPSSPTVLLPPGRTFDPNAYTFAFEPAAFKDKAGVSPRPAFINLEFTPEGEVTLEDRGYLFDGGTLQLDSGQLELLRANAARNQVMSFEAGITSTWDRQGNEAFPACLFMWGTSIDEANVALTQEGTNLFFYLKTTTPPENRSNHRIDLGVLQPEVTTHILVLYKANELTVFRDGVVTQRIRGSIKGRFTIWEQMDAFLGQGPVIAPGPQTTPWYGRLHQLCMKAGQDVSRRVGDFHERFLRAVAE